jgi:hypothetical protein
MKRSGNSSATVPGAALINRQKTIPVEAEIAGV